MKFGTAWEKWRKPTRPLRKSLPLGMPACWRNPTAFASFRWTFPSRQESLPEEQSVAQDGREEEQVFERLSNSLFRRHDDSTENDSLAGDENDQRRDGCDDK